MANSTTLRVFSREVKNMTRSLLLCLIGVLIVFVVPGQAEEVRVAVASNFLSTMKILASNFERNTSHQIIVISGSSGKLYAQIHHGAPFDVFFSADQHRPALLEQEGVAIKGSRFPYAVGRLTLWSPETQMIGKDARTTLAQAAFSHLAIANPKTAPYGRAAKQTLKTLGVWNQTRDRLVQGENIAQTFQFVSSRNAELGFVALTQVLSLTSSNQGSRWDVPPTLHDPLIQEAVLLTRGERTASAKAFLEYVQTPPALTMIQQQGYGLPDHSHEKHTQ
jgi:molybdate transport system substrate-binding protein